MNEIILQQGGRSLLLHVFQFTRQNATGRYVPKVSWQKVAGAVGFEPTMRDPKSRALPLGYTPAEIKMG
jgi:hypothetical protein